METQKQIVWERGEGEITEKKSRFIGEVTAVGSEEEALAYLESVRKKHYNARHHCFAYCIGENGELTRAGDDGEPSGTAGKPILNVLTGAHLKNAMIVVTRYFGGTLLGTGGLVRAYTDAAAEALRAAVLLEVHEGVRYAVGLDYGTLGRLQYMAASMELTTEKIEYTERVRAVFVMPAAQESTFLHQVTEMTGGQAEISEREPLQYGILDGEVIVL